MNLSKYEHAERKEAEASKDAPETPQDSGAEQKHHTLFGKQFTEKEQKTLFLYLVIGIVLMIWQSIKRPAFFKGETLGMDAPASTRRLKEAAR